MLIDSKLCFSTQMFIDGGKFFQDQVQQPLLECRLIRVVLAAGRTTRFRSGPDELFIHEDVIRVLHLLFRIKVSLGLLQGSSKRHCTARGSSANPCCRAFFSCTIFHSHKVFNNKTLSLSYPAHTQGPTYLILLRQLICMERHKHISNDFVKNTRMACRRFRGSSSRSSSTCFKQQAKKLI